METDQTAFIFWSSVRFEVPEAARTVSAVVVCSPVGTPIIRQVEVLLVVSAAEKFKDARVAIITD